MSDCIRVLVVGEGGGRQPRGEEGELEQLAALSRTHQGEIEREGEKKRGGGEPFREAIEEDGERKGRMMLTGGGL